jgi:hypothetical protein
LLLATSVWSNAIDDLLCLHRGYSFSRACRYTALHRIQRERTLQLLIVADYLE